MLPLARMSVFPSTKELLQPPAIHLDKQSKWGGNGIIYNQT